MKLQETIRRILREDKKDSTPLIEKVLNDMLVKYNKDILCGVTVVHPDNRITLSGGKYLHYKVTFTFIGGHGTKNWPKTMAIRDKYDEIMNEGWYLVHDFTGIPVDVYSEEIKECD